MLIRGKGNIASYTLDGKTRSYSDGDLRLVNMETVQMIEGIKASQGIYYLVAYVSTGRTNYGPISFNAVHPASYSLQPIDLKNITDIDKNNNFVNESNGYRVVLANKDDKFYRARDTNNIYIIRKYMRQLSRNMTYFILSFGNNFKNALTKLFSWNWLTTESSGGGKYSYTARTLMLHKLTNEEDSRYDDCLGVNGIEIVKLGRYTTKENIAVEINKIQREYSKFIRGTLSCFEPPKVYQLGADRLKASNIQAGNPYQGGGASYRYTTSPYISNNKVIADAGLYIDKNTWLRSGIDYDISFPTYSSSKKTYKLTYKFKGQYIGLGTKEVYFNFTK